ncbi:MAG: AmmeMemoRadiSam system protein B [Deltaproteobacteria bacterium]|nr:AmmeMemoRadiSam system protein B [Deltaproteobacteria bacterium]
MKREPFAARRGFYPSNPKALAAELDRWLPEATVARKVVAAVVPHAGYAYSGEVAGKVYAAIEVPDHVVILCPKHTPHGATRAIMTSGTWAMPGFDVPVDGELAVAIRDACALEEDEEAHRGEHSLEVQLPFLHRRNPKFALTPIAVGASRLETLRKLGEGLAKAIRAFGRPTLLLASSDMSHESGAARARKNDPVAIECMLALDAAGLYGKVTELDITMCGYAPATAVLTAAKALGATRAELLGYQTSLDHGGTEDWVVGYAGIVFE